VHACRSGRASGKSSKSPGGSNHGRLCMSSRTTKPDRDQPGEPFLGK
jgi:hypothetical protein